MNEDSRNNTHPGVARATGGPVGPILSLLASLKFALSTVALIALACIAGTVIPQGEQVSRYMERHPEAHGLMRALSGLGLTRVFTTWWFILLLLILAASLAVCTARRCAAIRRTTGAARTRTVGSFVTHVSLLLVLAGGVARVLWGQKGTIAFNEGDTVNHVAGTRQSFDLPFSVRLIDFELELYESPPGKGSPKGDTLVVKWPEKDLQLEFPIELGTAHPVAPSDTPLGAEPPFTVKVVRYIPDFIMEGTRGEVRSRSEAPNNPAVLVEASGGGQTHTEWVFARFPNFSRHGGTGGSATRLPLQFRFETASGAPAAGRRNTGAIKAFRSTLEILENGRVVRRPTIAVNSPFSYRGYAFYQSGYNEGDLTWTSLQVVRDPGVPVVYAGFVLMTVGLALVFCFGPRPGSEQRTTGETP